MATLKEIQLRLKSVKNIAKITKSMKMIASTKLTRAQKQMNTARVYGKASNAAFKFIEPKAAEGVKPLLISCSSDRGLCGAIHSTVSKPIKKACKEDPDLKVVAIGDKVKAQVSRGYRSNILLSVNSIGKQTPSFAEAAAITDLVFQAGVKFSEALIHFNEFKSAIAYELSVVKGFPVESLEASEKIAQYEVEDDVLKNYAEFSFANSLYTALAEGHASEISARRTAMENATKNAGEVIDNLTITYNSKRQAAITNELVDIITGASAL